MTPPGAGASAPYFDPRVRAWVLGVLPGRRAVVADPDLALTTLLGSCVAACLRDPERRVGGMNHFLLPGGGGSAARSARYGVHAMDLLIHDVLELGGRRGRLEAKVFGGANVIDTAARDTVGRSNAEFVFGYLRDAGIRVAASDVGGALARRVYFFPVSGRVRLLPLPPARPARNAAVAAPDAATTDARETF